MKHSPSFDGLAAFGRKLIDSKDVDPVYPVLRALYKQRRMTYAQELWQTTLYLAYYSLPSALAAFRLCPEPQLLTSSNNVLCWLPCAVERRGFRDGAKLLLHLTCVMGEFKKAGGIERWVRKGFQSGQTPEQRYELFWDNSQTIWGNGRWAAFKWAELMKKVHELPIAAPDMRLEHCSGPLDGLCELYAIPKTTPVATLNKFAQNLRNRLPALGLEVEDWEELETVLCNYHSHTQGKYEVGHDIHEMAHAIEKASQTFLDPKDAAALWEARAEALPHNYLKERRQ